MWISNAYWVVFSFSQLQSNKLAQITHPNKNALCAMQVLPRWNSRRRRRSPKPSRSALDSNDQNGNGAEEYMIYLIYLIYIYMCINIDLGCEHSTRCKKNIRLPSSQFNNHGEFKDRPHLLRRMNSLERTYVIFGISMTAPHLLFPQQRFLNCLRWILHDMTTMSYICAGLQNSNIGHVQLHRSNAWIPWIMAAPLSFTHATISLQRQEVPPVPILKAQVLHW